MRRAGVRVVLEGAPLQHLRPHPRPLPRELLLRPAGGEPGRARGVLHLPLSPLPGLLVELLALRLLGPLLRLLLGTERRLALPNLFEGLLEGLFLLLVLSLDPGLQLLYSLTGHLCTPFECLGVRPSKPRAHRTSTTPIVALVCLRRRASSGSTWRFQCCLNQAAIETASTRSSFMFSRQCS